MTGSVPVTKMGSTNNGVHWPAKRLPLNRDGNSANDSRQVGEPLSSPRPLEPGEHPTEETLSSPLSSFSRPHDLRQGAARGTRSARRKEIVSAFTWEALTIGKARTGELATSSGNSKGPRQLPIAVAPPNTPPSKMSRNRPRGPPLPRDNGLAANEETDMWNKILQDLRKAKEKNDKQKSLAEQISALNEKIGKDGGSKYLPSYPCFCLFYIGCLGERVYLGLRYYDSAPWHSGDTMLSRIMVASSIPICQPVASLVPCGLARSYLVASTC